MNAFAILVALTALGVESGYEPATDGQLEYIVQIEPQMVPQLAKGQDVTSELPRGLAVRHFRVTIGTGKLPRKAVDGRTTSKRLPTDATAAEPGIETQDVRVGFQPLAKGDGEYVIEITPTGLSDLDQHDLTGDIPANMAISRVRISTQPGSAPVDLVAATTPDPGARLAAADQPTLARGVPQPPPGQPIITPPTATNSNSSEPPLETLTPQEQSELANPEMDPKFQYPDDPAAEPIKSKAPARQTATDVAPALGNPQQGTLEHKNPPRAKGGDGQRPAKGKTPGQLTADPQSTPLTGKNVTYSDQDPGDEQATEHQTQKPSQEERKPAGTWKDAAKSEIKAGEEGLAEVEKRWPWYTLAITLLLFLSIGANLYMGWVAWDARNRARSLLERFRAGEVTMS